jgi:hypothetical membrane protein
MYSVSQNYVSDLGATCRATCQVVQPTATIFNSSVFLLGAFGVLGAFSIWRGLRTQILSVFLGLTGLGAMGVGLFPETTGPIHHLASLITFLFGGLSAVLSYRMQRTPQSYFSVVLGAMTLISLILYISKLYLGLGPGGMERMIVYPALIWAVGFGAHLTASSTGSNAKDTR